MQESRYIRFKLKNELTGKILRDDMCFEQALKEFLDTVRGSKDKHIGESLLIQKYEVEDDENNTEI